MKTKKAGYSHGECTIKEIDQIPENAVRIKIEDDKFKIADSEVTGNHHYIENAEGCEFYELDGVRYMRNTQPVKVSCEITERHSSFDVRPGTWKLDDYQEYDHISKQATAVRD